MAFLTALTLSLIFVTADTACGNEIVDIPLDKIWALEMPGTKNIRDLQEVPPALPNNELYKRSFVAQIQKALSHRNLPRYGEHPSTAIIVNGTELDALKDAARLLTEMNTLKEKKEPELIQPTETELSLVFYSYSCSRYVRLTVVEKAENVINVKFRFVSHATKNMSTHFAIIPLGKGLRGTVKVNVIEEQPIDSDGNHDSPFRDTKRYVSDSFTFRVQ